MIICPSLTCKVTNDAPHDDGDDVRERRHGGCEVCIWCRYLQDAEHDQRDDHEATNGYRQDQHHKIASAASTHDHASQLTKTKSKINNTTTKIAIEIERSGVIV